jgi:hypothetical protein
LNSREASETEVWLKIFPHQESRIPSLDQNATDSDGLKGFRVFEMSQLFQFNMGFLWN